MPALVSVEDRLAAPNTPESLNALRPAVDEAVARVTGAPPISVNQTGEPGGPLAAGVVLA